MSEHQSYSRYNAKSLVIDGALCVLWGADTNLLVRNGVRFPAESLRSKTKAKPEVNPTPPSSLKATMGRANIKGHRRVDFVDC